MIFHHLLDRLYLFLRYGDAGKERSVLAEKYFDSYTAAGSDVIFKPVALFGFLLMLVFIGVVVYGVLK